MYLDHFGLVEPPFSIVPNSRYLFLSERHREAMQHLKMGLANGGGFAMLTGEVGTGKTTVSKAMLATLDSDIVVGLILNPTFSSLELLEEICDQFNLQYPENATLKALASSIQAFLYLNHNAGKQTLLFIDEAQHLGADVLEQLRLLTNIETDDTKLLKVLLIGQPELQQNLQRTELRQLAQRITGRYHLLPLVKAEVSDYIQFRLQLANASSSLFTSSAIKAIADATQGVPRLINLVCDKSLQLAYLSGVKEVSRQLASNAITDIMSFQAPSSGTQNTRITSSKSKLPVLGVSAVALAIAAVYFQPQIFNSVAELVVSEKEPVSVEAAAEIVAERIIETTAETKKLEESEQEIVPFVKQAIVDDSTPLWVLDTLQSSEHYFDSMQVLFSVWGYEASIMQSKCYTDTPSPFFCEEMVGEIGEVIAFNRPVVLTLQMNDETVYAVLYRVFDDRMELLIAGNRIAMPIEWLEGRWLGEYRTLWFSEVQTTLKIGDRGEGVRKLDLLLSQVLSDTATNNDIFTSQLKARVKTFQSWQGLYVDGIAGKKTLQTLDKLANSSAPKLIFTPSLAEQEQSPQTFKMLPYPQFDSLSALVDSANPNFAPTVETATVIPQEIKSEVSLVESKPLPELVISEEPPEFDFDQLDLSELAPELASRVKSAMQPSDAGDENRPELEEIEVYDIEALPQSIMKYIPDLDFQSHMYASQPNKRWVKMNGQEYQEGEWFNDDIMVELIEPRRVILDVLGNKVAVPSLYEWQAK